ncbi:MAG: ABC transporter substrate-binding protein [Lachnospiraceae bacterium]|nr:ABC transporter substrate-binding protein [Lachnospiraceae bacterium]
MKKRSLQKIGVFTLLGASMLLLFAGITACKKKTADPTTPVTLNEVAHSIFYAPMYVAMENGYFSEEGIDLTLVTGFGADKTMTAVVSGDADIGFMGTEASIYAYAEGAKDYVINFAQLTQRAGNFLVAREPNDSFDWNTLKDTDVLGGRAGGTPEMVFEYILKQKCIDPAKDLRIDQSIDFGSTAAAFSGGQGDYTIEFEPGATALEKEGAGYVVASLGVESGYLPYTAFSAKKSYMEKNPKVIEAFTKALQKGMEYTSKHTPAEIAAVIQPQFKDTDLETITTIVTRYYDQDTWKTDLILTKDSYELMTGILKDAGVLDTDVPYEKLVTTEYAKEALKK